MIDVLLADAVVAAVSGQRSGERRVPEICVHIDYATMLNGLHEHSLCETSDGIPLPPETVRRLACEAAIVPIMLNSAGEVLNCGRDVRVANRAQRRALRAMYRTCAYPGCDISFDRCDIHHVIAWIRHGTTDLDNLLPLCSQHHHLVHEGHGDSNSTDTGSSPSTDPTAPDTSTAPPPTEPGATIRYARPPRRYAPPKLDDLLHAPRQRALQHGQGFVSPRRRVGR